MQHDSFNTNTIFHVNVKDGHISEEDAATFKALIWNYYQEHGRTFSWRQTSNPYHIVVSEIMLQQTQTHRVEDKYARFIAALPDFKALAEAPQREVLGLWQGLGYNRRAIALQKTAQKVMDEFQGVLPDDPALLVEFPGIGPATASSICAFAYNKPTVFIETNIRAVFIHHFFHSQEKVHDNQIMPLVVLTVDAGNARQWYYALMDYGVMLKKKYKNPSRNSKHHTQQSTFEGSDRQIRGLILKLLLEYQRLKLQELLSLLEEKVECSSLRGQKIIESLEGERLIFYQDPYYQL